MIETKNSVFAVKSTMYYRCNADCIWNLLLMQLHISGSLHKGAGKGAKSLSKRNQVTGG